MEGLRIYRAGKASQIIIAAGNRTEQSSFRPEAELIADLLVEFGAPRSSLVLETKSRNTHENAINTAAIFRDHGWRHGVLVTSGIHMPRAMAAFRKQGMHLSAASRDIHGMSINQFRPTDFLPDPGSLAKSSSAIREMIGLWIYRFRGWA